MYKLYCRLYQNTFKLVSCFLPWREPQLLTGENSLSKLPIHLNSNNIDRVLIVTDKGITSIGLLDEFLKQLKEAGVKYFIYDKTVPNPTIYNMKMHYLFTTKVSVKVSLHLVVDHRLIVQKRSGRVLLDRKKVFLK